MTMSLIQIVRKKRKNGRPRSTLALSRLNILVLVSSRATSIRSPLPTSRISEVAISIEFLHLIGFSGSHKAETAVTSDEEAGVSGDESKRPKGWTRRISGSFGKLTGGSKDKEPATEAPREIPVVAPTESTADATPETADVEAPVAAEVTEPAGTEAPAETPATEGTNFVSHGSNVLRTGNVKEGETQVLHWIRQFLQVKDRQGIVA